MSKQPAAGETNQNTIQKIQLITRDQVDDVPSYWNEVGREDFLERFGVNDSLKFVIRCKGKRYDI